MGVDSRIFQFASTLPCMADSATVAAAAAKTILGFKAFEFWTLVGVFLGPVFAVLITLWHQSRSQQHDRRVNVLRMLLATRMMPSDASYNLAINLVPVEFNKSDKVMRAWSDYMQSVKVEPQPTPESQVAAANTMAIKQTRLIFAIMQSLGLKLAETDIQTESYVSKGFLIRDSLYLDSLVAMRDIANAMREQAEVLKRQLTQATEH